MKKAWLFARKHSTLSNFSRCVRHIKKQIVCMMIWCSTNKQDIKNAYHIICSQSQDVFCFPFHFCCIKQKIVYLNVPSQIFCNVVCTCQRIMWCRMLVVGCFSVRKLEFSLTPSLQTRAILQFIKHLFYEIFIQCSVLLQLYQRVMAKQRLSKYGRRQRR